MAKIHPRDDDTIFIMIRFLIILQVSVDLNDIKTTPYDTFFVYLLMFFLSYITAYIVIETYDMAIDTILMCVLMDEDENKNVAGPNCDKYYADPEITQYLDDSEHEAFESDKAADKNNALGTKATPMGDSVGTV